MGLETTTQWHEASHQYLEKLYIPLSLPYAVGLVQPAPASTGVAIVSAPVSLQGFRILSFEVTFNHSANMNVNDNWNIRLIRYDNTGATAVIQTINTWQTGRVAGTYYHDYAMVNSTFNSTTCIQLYVDAIKLNAGGNLTISPPVVWIRPLF